MKLQSILEATKIQEQDRIDELLPAIPAILTGLRLLGPIILRHATKDAVKKAVVGKVGKEAVKKAVVQGAKGSAKVTKDVIKKAAPVVGKAGKEIGKKTIGPAVGGAVVVGGVSYVVDQAFDKLDEALKFLMELFDDLFDIETLKKIAEMLVKYSLPIAGVLAVAYGGKVLVDYIRSEGDDPEEYDDELTMEDADLTENMIGEPDNYYDAEERTEAYKDLQKALAQSSSIEAEYVKDGHCPECPNVEDDEDCYGFGNYGCDDGILTYGDEDVSWKAIKDHDERQAERQSAKDTYPGDEKVINQVANMVKNMDDPRDAMQQLAVDYPQMGRRQRADLVSKGMKLAGLTKEGKSPHKKGTAKHKKHMAAMHAGMGEGMNEEQHIEKIRNSKGEIIQYTILNGQPFDVNGAPLEYGPYWDIMTADGHSDIEINSHMWPNYERDTSGVKGYESIQAGDELMIETGMGEGIVAPVLHVVGENVLISWDATADSLFEETEEIDEGEKHGNSKIYNKCWKGYSKVPGKSAGEKGSCKKNEGRVEETVRDSDYMDFQDMYMQYLHALRKSGKINMFGAPRELQREFGLSKEQSYEVFNNWKDSFNEASFDQNAFDKIFKDRKSNKSTKPDFIDIDGDGDKQEPMKKAVNDKKKTTESDMERLRKLAGLSEGEERTDITQLMIPHIKEYLESKGPGSFISMEDLESDLYDFARQITHDDLNSPQDLRDFMSNPGDEASSAVGELVSGMYQAEFDDYIDENTKDEQLPHCHLCKGKGCDDCDNTGEDDGYPRSTKDFKREGRIEDTFGTHTIDKHDKKRKPRKEDIELARLRELAGLTEEVVDLERFKQILKLIKRDGMGRATGDDNKITSELNKWLNDQVRQGYKYDSKDPMNVARMLLKFEEETGYKTFKQMPRPPKQTELPLTPGTPQQKEFDFDEGKGPDYDASDIWRGDAITCKACKGKGCDHCDYKGVHAKDDVKEAEYQGRKVKLGKPTRGDVKKFKVYVKDPKTGNVKKVNFGHGGSSAKKAGQKTMKIKKSNPARRKSFRARHNCDNPGPRTKARYWSCRAW